MESSVLYYPFIRVPESDWLTRILLYWDSVGTIAPYEFLQEPERLGPHTQGLVREGLIQPVFPADYVHNLAGFEEEFLGFLHSVGPELESRRERFQAGQHAPIHLEKLGALAQSLTDLRLAREDGNWSLVELETAEEFMAYLASVLGQLPVVHAVPVSDRDSGIARLAGPSPDSRTEARLKSLRMAVIEDVFPSPSGPLEAADIAVFKRNHGDLLKRFRLEVEKEVIRLADLENEELRQAAARNLSDRIQEDIREIESKLQESGFGGVSTSKWLAVLGNVPVVGKVVNILTSVRALFEREEKRLIGPFAYAGYAKAQLLDR
jgi:hypothetical protein